MSTVVIMPGGFHPLHAGHMALYNSAKEAFPNAQVYVAATNDTKTRPFPFAIKEKLAKVAGIDPKHFVQVKSPFQPREITDKFNPEQDVVIFVRSEKDRNESPKPGGTKKDGSPAYFQSYTGKDVQPFGEHAYMAYLPTVEFGPGISSATEIRNAWPTLNDRRKTAMVMSLYPATQKNPKLAANVVKMLDMGMGNELDEGWKQNLGAAALAGGIALGGLSSMGKTVDTNWDKLPQQISTQKDSRGDEKIMSVTGPNNKGEYRVRVTTDDDMKEFITKTPPKKLNEFAPPSSDRGDGGDEKSYLLQLADDLADAMYGPNKNTQEVKNVSGKILAAGGNVKISWNDDGTFNVVMYHPVYFKQGYLIRLVGRGDQDVAEGKVVPFKQPSKALTWKQVPKDILLLANDWFWAEYDNTGLDAVIDPKGFGNGTANELQYITAKLQQKGWTIDYNYENDGPDEYNLILTNKRGQTVLLPIEDAQTFSGWAKGTSQYDLEEAEKTAKVFHPQYVDVYYLDGPRRTPLLVNRKVPYKLIDRYLELAIKKYNLQQGRFEFRNAEEQVDEGWKTKLGAAALTGAMALGASGAHSADISSPTFNGMQTISHNDGSNTTKYNSGPLSMQLTKNKQGKTTSAQRNYQIGDTNVGVGTNAIGVNTLTATGDKADNLVGVGPSAERLKVSPEKIKAFQQGVKESSFKKSNVSKNQDYLEEK